MLSAEHLYELPLELRIYIANMDMETYTRMYLYDAEFKICAFNISDFIKRFVVTIYDDYVWYRIGGVNYYKYNNGEEHWYKNGKRHRLDGPALIDRGGMIGYYVHGLLHRLDGPAAIYPDGYKSYYQHGERHRLDGPAIIYPDGKEEYWRNGVRI